MVGGKKYCIEGPSSIKICTNDGKIKLNKILYMPSLKKNLISIDCLGKIKKLIALSNHNY